MSGDLQVKTPVAIAVLTALVFSVGLNIWSLARGQQVILMGAPGATGPVRATLPNGEPDPLSHVPASPTDAVGMPDATGGAGQ